MLNMVFPFQTFILLFLKYCLHVSVIVKDASLRYFELDSLLPRNCGLAILAPVSCSYFYREDCGGMGSCWHRYPDVKAKRHPHSHRSAARLCAEISDAHAPSEHPSTCQDSQTHRGTDSFPSKIEDGKSPL